MPVRVRTGACRDRGSESVLSSIEMRGPRPRLRHQVLGPLTAALALHGFGLALAATSGFRAVAQAEETFDTFALSLRPVLAQGPGLAGEGQDEGETRISAAALEDLEASAESAESAEEEALLQLLVLEPLPATLLPEASFLEAEAPVVLDPVPADPLAPDASALVAEATKTPAPLGAPALLASVGAAAPALGSEAQAESVPLALRARGATT